MLISKYLLHMSDYFYVDKFLKTDELQPSAVYYFDPPLNEMEMIQLKTLFINIEGNDLITRPINFTRNSIFNNDLLWFSTDRFCKINGWQNTKKELNNTYSDDPFYAKLANYDDVIKWHDNYNKNPEFINGRSFISQDIEDLFDKLNEQTDDEFNWVTDLGLPKNVDEKHLSSIGKYKLKPLSINDLSVGMFIKRKKGKFLYMLGRQVTNLSYTTDNGFILENLSNGRSYFSKTRQIIKEFYSIILE